MKTTQKLAAIVLALLLGGTIYGLLRTGQPPATTTTNGKGNHDTIAQAPLGDQTPLQTAQRLAKMATSEKELPFAQEALRLGDQELDLALAASVRNAPKQLPVFDSL